ncbi:MAG: hypothetical protein KBD78_02855 [Oligoflexales bacterium]|nr:hypothetical protein [Oligoflexales bacterium]
MAFSTLEVILNEEKDLVQILPRCACQDDSSRCACQDDSSGLQNWSVIINQTKVPKKVSPLRPLYTQLYSELTSVSSHIMAKD